MERKRFENAPCSIARALDVLGDWWKPLIIRECMYGVVRFSELQFNLDIGRNILSGRIDELVDQGILEKRRYQERPPRYEYHLTEKGYDAAKVLVAMMAFGEAWLFGEQGVPIELFDRRTGQRIEPTLVDARTQAPVDPRQLIVGPGPAFPHHEPTRRSRFREYYERGLDPRPPPSPGSSDPPDD